MKYLITLIFLLTLTAIAHAQPLPPTDNPVPLDGGILALLVAGAAYGAKRLKQSS
jgi:hypothetical protein